MKVGVSLGLTVNLGDYESLRLDVRIDEIEVGETPEAMKQALATWEDAVEVSVAALAVKAREFGGGNAKKKLENV